MNFKIVSCYVALVESNDGIYIYYSKLKQFTIDRFTKFVQTPIFDSTFRSNTFSFTRPFWKQFYVG